MLTEILALAPAADPVNPQVTEDTAQGLVGLLHHLATDPTGMQILWFALIAVLWTGYLVLEGFDFGVGMLLPILGKKNNERRAMLSTIGPLWDGNEVWVLTAGGATFAAFPEWYATLFSAAYLPLFLILVGLIIRAVAFEYRGKINGDGWRKLWDWCIVLGSWIPAVLWGVAFANLVAGVKAYVDPTQLGSSKILYAGTFWDLVFAHQGFLLLGGATTAALFLAHGSIFLSLKTDGVVRERAEKLSSKLALVATVIAAAWALWLGFKFNGGNHPTLLVWIGIILAAVALLVVVLTTLQKKFGLAFGSMTVALLAAVVTIFAALFPNVINAAKVQLKGDAVADPIVGAVVLDGVNLEDVVNITFGRVKDDGLPEVPGEVQGKAGDLTVGILENVRDESYPALDLIPQEGVKDVVVATFNRVKDSGADLAQVGKDVTEPSELALAITVGVLDDVANGKDPALGVIPLENVADVVNITLMRVGVIPAPDEAVVGLVVKDLQSDAIKAALGKLRAGEIQVSDLAGAQIAGLDAAVVAAQVAITVEALVPAIEASVNQVVNVEVPATLQAVADDSKTSTFKADMDVTEIVTGELADLNPRIDAANEALDALVALGLLEEHKALEKFEKGDTITGQPIFASASSPLTLKLMTIVAICLVPIVLAYQAWSIWVFRRRISAERIPADSGLEPAGAK